MGCDIHPSVEVKNKDGVWEDKGCPHALQFRNYDRFSFLTGGLVRNYANLPQLLPEPRGFPVESARYAEVKHLEEKYGSAGDYHSASYLSLTELLAVDYDKRYLDREPNATLLTLRELVRMDKIIEELKTYDDNPDNVRILFDFDN